MAVTLVYCVCVFSSSGVFISLSSYSVSDLLLLNLLVFLRSDVPVFSTFPLRLSFLRDKANCP